MTTAMTKAEIHEHIRQIMHELFELDPEQITLEADLNRDLDIDSIDVVDLLAALKKQTGKKVSAEDFKHVRTVGDMVNAVDNLVADS